MVKPNGVFAISGIINSQVEEITKIYIKYLKLNPPVLKEEWCLISGVKL